MFEYQDYQNWQQFLMENADTTAAEQFSGETKVRRNDSVSVRDDETEYMSGRFSNNSESSDWTKFPM